MRDLPKADMFGPGFQNLHVFQRPSVCVLNPI